MMPDPRLIAKRKKFSLVIAALTSYGIGIASLVSDPSWTAWSVVGTVVVIIGPAGLVYLAWPGSGRFLAWSESDAFLVPAPPRRSGGAPGAGAPGHGLGLRTESGPAPVTAGRWLALRAAARLMPPAAGRRWLAEAESLLFEQTPARRRRAVRSYLLCTPRLVVMMWLGGLTRRTWSHSRRRG
jgi:hypothetical protein